MSKNSSNSFLAFLIGALTGAFLGVLFAPEKGVHTRDKLSYRLDKYKLKLEELIDELIKGKGMVHSEAREEGEKIISDAKEKAERLLDDVNGLLDQIQKK